MVRTIVSFDPNEKAWLDEEARIEHVSMTEIVRKAVRLYRLSVEAQKKPDFTGLLKKTAGIWEHEDGLEYQRKIRKEWDK